MFLCCGRRLRSIWVVFIQMLKVVGWFVVKKISVIKVLIEIVVLGFYYCFNGSGFLNLFQRFSFVYLYLFFCFEALLMIVDYLVWFLFLNSETVLVCVIFVYFSNTIISCIFRKDRFWYQNGRNSILMLGYIQFCMLLFLVKKIKNKIFFVYVVFG